MGREVSDEDVRDDLEDGACHPEALLGFNRR